MNASTSLADGVYSTLKERILRFEYSAGDPLTELALASELRISRTPIRQALQRLGHDNLVDIIPRKGVVVKGISEAEIKEVYLIRQGLEGICCRRTAELISEQKLQKLEAAMEKANKLVEEGQPDEASESADELHRVILSMGSEGRIETIVKSITEITYWLHQIALATPGRLEKSIQEHAHVVEALKARDADEAEKRIRAHIRSTEADVLAVYINHK